MFPELTLEQSILQKYYDRLTSNSIIEPETNCWLWQGYQIKGYGVTELNHKPWRVHRISAMIFLGLDTLDTKDQVNHRRECSNKNCWNPDHIYIGTQQDNVHDSLTSRFGGFRKSQSQCKHGHEYTPENTYTDPRGHRQCKTCIKERQC